MLGLKYVFIMHILVGTDIERPIYSSGPQYYYFTVFTLRTVNIPYNYDRCTATGKDTSP